MKKRSSFRLAAAGILLLLSTFSPVSVFAAETDSVISSNEEKLTPQISLGPGYAGNYGLTAENIKNPTAEENTEAPSSPETVETGEPDQYLGSFHASAYCNCVKCSGGHSLTYSGTVPQANHTIAADLTVYPIGTKLLINGIVYTVEDKGGNINGNRLDIFFATHEDALAFGVQEVEVYTVKIPVSDTDADRQPSSS